MQKGALKMSKIEMLKYQLEADRCHIRSKLFSAANWLAEDLVKLTKQLMSGEGYNSLGVVQGRGSEVDRLCGELRQLDDTIARLKVYLENEATNS